MAKSIFKELKTALKKELDSTTSKAAADMQEEITVRYKQNIDQFIVNLINTSVLSALKSELYFAEHRMDISDSFVREKILTLTKLIEKLNKIKVSESWSLVVNDDLTMEMQFVEEYDTEFNRIDSGTKFIPQIKFLDAIKDFVNSLLGVRNI